MSKSEAENIPARRPQHRRGGGFLMTTAKAIAGLPSGRRTKWAVLVFWLVVAVVASPLAGKLMGAEKNDAKSWLPAAAESTRVLAIQDRVQSANVFPAVMVYYGASGLSAADRAKATADIRRFARVRYVVPGQAAGPFLAADKKAIETIVNVDLGSKGPNAAARAASSLRVLAGSGDAGLSAYITGPLGSAADSDNALTGIDPPLLFSALGVVVILLLITYPSPR